MPRPTTITVGDQQGPVDRVGVVGEIVAGENAGGGVASLPGTAQRTVT